MGKAKDKGAAPVTPALEDMTQEELMELAIEKGVDLEAGMEKEAIIARLIEADPSLADDDQDSTDDDTDSDVDEIEPAKEVPGDEIKVGTIRTMKGVEMVKINDSADGWVPTIRENVEAGKPVTIVCPKRAGKTIFARTGKPITLDANGKATVSAADGFYLSNIIINGKPEYTVE